MIANDTSRCLTCNRLFGVDVIGNIFVAHSSDMVKGLSDGLESPSCILEIKCHSCKSMMSLYTYIGVKKGEDEWEDQKRTTIPQMRGVRGVNRKT